MQVQHVMRMRDSTPLEGVFVRPMRVTKLLVVTILAVMMAFSTAQNALADSRVTVPRLTRSVTIDGKWTTGDEWTDAVEVLGIPAECTAMPCGSKTATHFRIKYDDAYIYILADNTADSELDAGTTIDSPQIDIAAIDIDTLKDGGSAPRTDDYAFQIYFTHLNASEIGYAIHMIEGTGTCWCQQPSPLFSGAASLGISEDPYSTSSHVVYEWKIPNSVLPKDTVAVGFRVAMRDGKTNSFWLWPPQNPMADPNHWGELDFSTPVPEFSSGVLVIVGCMATVVVARKKRSP